MGCQDRGKCTERVSRTVKLLKEECGKNGSFQSKSICWNYEGVRWFRVKANKECEASKGNKGWNRKRVKTNWGM